MAGSPRLRFLAIAVVFHSVFIFSIFDIYFVSPIVSGMQLFGVERPAETKAPADRLVLFVGEYMACGFGGYDKRTSQTVGQ
jgi:phosphatidylinositol glycan class N